MQNLSPQNPKVTPSPPTPEPVDAPRASPAPRPSPRGSGGSRARRCPRPVPQTHTRDPSPRSPPSTAAVPFPTLPSQRQQKTKVDREGWRGAKGAGETGGRAPRIGRKRGQRAGQRRWSRAAAEEGRAAPDLEQGGQGRQGRGRH